MTTSLPSSTRLTWLILLGSAGAFGLLIWLMLPSMVVVMDDDFWYLKSVVETFQRGRPWTSEYLAPWAASTSSLAAIMFALTDSMSIAVHGQLAVAAGLAFLGLTLWLKDEGLGPVRRVPLALVLLASPTVLFMFLMFTGAALYWGCFWMCIWAFGRRNWLAFFLFWAIALANRQSAIGWMALPFWFMLEEGWKQRNWRPAVLIVAGGVWFLAVKSGMNANTGQAWVNHTTFDLSGLGTRHVTLALCLAALVAGFGLGGLIKPSQRSINPWLAIVAMLVGSQIAINCVSWLQWTHSGYNDSWQRLYFGAGGTLAGLGLIMAWRRPSGGALLAALGCATLLTLYSGKFDYYFVEMVWWGVVASVMGAKSSSAAPPSPLWSRLGLVLTVVVLVCDARFLVRLKLDQHRITAFNTLYEKAYRDGTLKLHESGLTTMGHLGWWLEDHYREKTGTKPGDLAGFILMCDAWDSTDGGTSLVTEFPKLIRRYSDWLPQRTSKMLNKPEAREIGVLKQRILFFWEATYRLKQIKRRNPPPRQVEIDYATFKESPFPLNDDEWSRLMRGP